MCALSSCDDSSLCIVSADSWRHLQSCAVLCVSHHPFHGVPPSRVPVALPQCHALHLPELFLKGKGPPSTSYPSSYVWTEEYSSPFSEGPLATRYVHTCVHTRYTRTESKGLSHVVCVSTHLSSLWCVAGNEEEEAAQVEDTDGQVSPGHH